jgi:hypothetical protein
VKLPQSHAESLDDLRPHSLAFSDQSEEDVLGTELALAELQRLTKGQFKKLLRPRREL